MKYNTVEFYVNNFVYLKSGEEIDVNFLSPIVKRRLSKFDKCVLTILKNAYDDDIQNIVFSSQYGEVERLMKLISQYSEEKEVSPNVFSGSVHNYPVGFFLLNKKKSIPYSAIAAGNNSISSGLLSSVISNYNNILYCYTDVHENDIFSMGLSISKTKKVNSKKFIINTTKKVEKSDNFDDYISLFLSKITLLETNLFKIERVDYEK